MYIAHCVRFEREDFLFFFNEKQFCDLLIEVKSNRNNNNKTFICSNEKGPVQNRMQTVAAA